MPKWKKRGIAVLQTLLETYLGPVLLLSFLTKHRIATCLAKKFYYLTFLISKSGHTQLEVIGWQVQPKYVLCPFFLVWNTVELLEMQHPSWDTEVTRMRERDSHMLMRGGRAERSQMGLCWHTGSWDSLALPLGFFYLRKIDPLFVQKMHKHSILKIWW